MAKGILSIDADYTSNSGFDTVDDFKINKTPTGISNTFYDIFKTIKDKNIKPEIISMSLSPQYLPKKDHEFVNNLFKEIIQISGMRDEINTYKRRYDPDPHYIENIMTDRIYSIVKTLSRQAFAEYCHSR